ncbi:MAG: preprotein translocase subunit SecG [Muribaculaceae bacterium]|nr:preprotein translocase subunit SecG [Muribaculaceae bacterium]
MTLYVIFAVLILIASVLLVGVVLIQKSKGGGLAANVSGYNQFAGVKRTTEFVEKATWALAIFICVLSIASAFVQAPSIVQGTPQIKKLPGVETQAPSFETQTQEQAAPAATEAPAAPAAEAPAK